MLTTGIRLEVWGDPISHSRSPELHAAAYRVLGLDWSYGRRRVDEVGFPRALAELGPEFRGLSLTMPLKGAAYAAATSRDPWAEATGAVNTLRITDDALLGVNTDVGGLVRDLREHGVGDITAARLVGAGATATSALVSLSALGVRDVTVVARRPEAVAPLRTLGDRLGVQVTVAPLDASVHEEVPLTIAALPGGAAVSAAAADALAAAGGTLYDVVYGHWPTALARGWERAGGRAIPGIGMLLHQALLQVRVFVSGDAELPLAEEDAVLAAMRAVIADDHAHSDMGD